MKSVFDYFNKKEKLDLILIQLNDPKMWNQYKVLGKEKKNLEIIINKIDKLNECITFCEELIMIIEESEDNNIFINELNLEIKSFYKLLNKLEFIKMFSKPMDINNAFLDIKSGSGGIESQDWASILMRMYLRWADYHNFKTEIIELSYGDVSGIKSCTIHFDSQYSYGWLRTETGIHRLVRKSPFDSGHRRHTSFASIFIYPEVNDKLYLKINTSDLRIDTYRASGAGGQHVNRTDSAVRITHKPTNVVVQCQSHRSQHKNKDQAMKQLQSKIYEIEMKKKQLKKQQLEEDKSDISWGNQIRSYIFDQSRIKDLRTGWEEGNITAVLNGNLDNFIKESLTKGL